MSWIHASQQRDGTWFVWRKPNVPFMTDDMKIYESDTLVIFWWKAQKCYDFFIREDQVTHVEDQVTHVTLTDAP